MPVWYGILWKTNNELEVCFSGVYKRSTTVNNSFTEDMEDEANGLSDAKKLQVWKKIHSSCNRMSLKKSFGVFHRLMLICVRKTVRKDGLSIINYGVH